MVRSGRGFDKTWRPGKIELQQAKEKMSQKRTWIIRAKLLLWGIQKNDETIDYCPWCACDVRACCNPAGIGRLSKPILSSSPEHQPGRNDFYWRAGSQHNARLSIRLMQREFPLIIPRSDGGRRPLISTTLHHRFLLIQREGQARFTWTRQILTGTKGNGTSLPLIKTNGQNPAWEQSSTSKHQNLP